MTKLLRKQASLRARFILFETNIGEEPYQVIAQPVYVPGSRTVLRGIVGFTVNLNWVRAHYFNELTAQLSRVVVGRGSMILEVFDEKGQVITSNRPALGVQAIRNRCASENFRLCSSIRYSARQRRRKLCRFDIGPRGLKRLRMNRFWRPHAAPGARSC